MRSVRVSSALLVAAISGLVAFVAPASAEFGLQSFQSTLRDSTDVAEPEPQAGAHPSGQQIEFSFNTIQHHYPDYLQSGGSGPNPDPDDQVKDTITELPPGLVGNPQAVPQCPQRDFPPAGFGGPTRCPTDSQIGVATLALGAASGYGPDPVRTRPLYNLTPPKGVLARIGFAEVIPVVVDIKVRTGGDYGLTATVHNLAQTANIYSVKFTVWGVPAAAEHDALRFREEAFLPGDELGNPLESTLSKVPFMSNPTRCGVDLPTHMEVDSWQNPGIWHAYTAPTTMRFVGCSQVDFDPSIEVHATTTVADAPTGLEFNLHIPQNEDPDRLTTAHMRDAVVKLPPGMTVNPPSADTLRACSLAEVGMSAIGVADGDPVACPNSSILGTVAVKTPSLDHLLKGNMYLARQTENPFRSLLAVYLVLDDPISGLRIKLPGKVDPDPRTGQLTVSFMENPQLPVEDLKVKLFSGPHASLKTPEGCGRQTTTASLTPWTAPEGAVAERSSSFDLLNGPSGGACVATGPAAPNQPSFVAGTVDPAAKAFSPFTFKLARADGTQQLKAIDTTLPRGLIGKLAGIPYCSDASLAAAATKSGRAEQSSASCPTASRVGGVTVGAGAGATPLYVSGEAYLAGPYKGAPLSLAVITPAVAGPFDLGTVVVRNALYVNPETTQVRAVSDPLPTILQGIPLDLRSIVLNLDRPSFTLNPTSCDPLTVLGSATSVFNQSAPLSSPFQVDECGRLGFKPRLKLSLRGGTSRSDHPALRAILTARPGDANIGRASVALPHSEFLAQNHIRTVCTRVQFAAGAGNGAECPKGSIYGTAAATTPLLDQPISGPVYLRSSSNTLPDLVAALHGQIDIEVVGRIDSIDGGIRTTFSSVPDAPVTRFVLSMRGGKKGLLENSRSLCRSPSKAKVVMNGQNGRSIEMRPALRNSCHKRG